MDKIRIVGGNELNGTVTINGSKNSVLPILSAALLASEGTSVVYPVPRLSDVENLVNILEHLGVEIKWEKDTVTINSENIKRHDANLDCVSDLRASFLILGPLIARFNRGEIAQPGGCAIGARPIDLHFKGLEALGVSFKHSHGSIIGECSELLGNRIYLDFPSVGATENIMMTAALAKGDTIIENAAEEPEIVDLANYLNNMGAKIRGAGTNEIRIKGVLKLKGVNHQVIPDRIEAGTYMVAVAATGGRVTLKNVIKEHLTPVIAKLREAKIKVIEGDDSIIIESKGSRAAMGITIKTMPHPGFPTDMQPQFVAFLLLSKGRSYITETIFERRFQHVDEFLKMGGDVVMAGNTVALSGVEEIYGAHVNASDLRAGAALIIAGLVAEGITLVGNVHFIDRGYENIVQNIKNLGGNIERLKID